MAPVANPPPDVALVVVLDRYCQPAQLSMVIPLMTALMKQYPESHAKGQIRMASVTYDTTQMNEMLNPTHYFENIDAMPAKFQSKEVCLNRFGIRPNTGAKGKSAMVEGMLLEMHAIEPFIELALPGPPVLSHTKLRAFSDSGVRKHVTPPVRYMVVLSALLPDTGARAIRNNYRKYDGCSWGQLPDKLKELDVNLSMVYLHSTPKIPALHAAATVHPSELWFHKPPQWPNFQVLLAGFDTKLLTQQPNQTKRPTPDSEASQSPNSKRARTSVDGTAAAGNQPSAPQAPAVPAGQPSALPSNPASQPVPAPAAPTQPAAAPVQPAPGGLAGRRFAAPNISLPPLPPGAGVNVPSQQQTTTQPAPGQPGMPSGGPPNVPLQWQSVLALNQAQNGTGAPRGPIPRPNSVVPGTATKGPAGGHSRSVSMQGVSNGQNGVAAPVPTQPPAPLLAGAQGGNINITGHARAASTNGAFPVQPQPAAGAPQQANGVGSHTTPITLPSPRHHPPGTSYPFPPSPPLQSVDLNDSEAVKRAVDKACNDYFQQLPVLLQQKVSQDLKSNVQAATVDDLARAKAHAILGALGMTARRFQSVKHERMHQNLFELSMARWPQQINTAAAGPSSSLAISASNNAAAAQQQATVQVPPRPESASANGAAVQAQQQRFLIQQQQYHRQQAVAAMQKAQAQAQQAQQVQVAQQQAQVAQQQAQAAQQQGQPTPPQPDSPHIPLSSQVASRQLPGARPGAPGGLLGQGSNQMRNSPIPGENQPPPGIARPPTTQPTPVQQQLAHMQQMGQQSMGMMQQNQLQQTLPPQMQQGMPLMANNQMVPQQQPGGMQALNQGQGGGDALRPQTAPNEVLRDVIFTWKSDTSPQDFVVCAGLSRLNRMQTPSEALQQLLRTWPSRIPAPTWFPNRLMEKSTLQRLMDLTLMFRITPTSNDKMGDKAMLNQTMFTQFYDMFQVGNRMAYVSLPMNGRQDTGLVLIHPPVPKHIRMILAFCFHDKPVPPLLMGAAPPNVPGPAHNIIPQNPSMQMQAQQAQQPPQQQQPTPQQQAIMSGRPGQQLTTEQQRLAFMRMAMQAHQKAQQQQAQSQAQGQNQGQMQQQQVPQPGQPQAVPHQTPQQQPQLQQSIQRTPMQQQVQAQQMQPQPQQQPQQQQQPQPQPQQRSTISAAQHAQLQAIIRSEAPPAGVDPVRWQQQRQMAHNTLLQLRQTQLQAASGMQNQAQNQNGMQGVQGGMANGMGGNMGGMNNAAMNAMAQGLMLSNNGGVGQQNGMGLPGGGGGGMTINTAMQNMFNQPSLQQQQNAGGLSAFNAQQMQQAQQAQQAQQMQQNMNGMGMSGLNMGNLGMGNMQQQGGFNQGNQQGQMMPMNLGFGMQQQQQQQQGQQGSNQQMSLDLLQQYLRSNNKEGTM
ncbi:hypothetical protein CALVIDRAFT_536400 [Calocera viscosa TUFC12733]|uniref:Uncharacterized protein n=1 Tax=Calocera viscosa (strain TUFC12733) TaxID=1330018 RepID=A0A167N698_CALVF|nr:hypothetical protein CALVIDRAFT_536400 [Calocera viscosa TUFC12733]